MIAVALLVGCNSMPASIPNSPGQIDAAIAPDLLAVTSPDLPYLFWAVASGLIGEQYRSCPAVYTETNGNAIVANNCYDSVGLLWDGKLSWTVDGTSNYLTFNDFSVQGMQGAWKVDGLITIVEADHDVGPAYVMTNKIAVTSYDDPERTFWVDTKGSLSLWEDASSTGTTWIGWDEYDGTVGISDWGTAEIEGDRIVSGQANGCAYGDHWAGTIALTGSNNGEIDYSKVDTSEDTQPSGGDWGAEPRANLDSADTGLPGDTAADTGTDTGTSDTGDTGTSDTGDTGTSDTGGPTGSFPIWPTEGSLESCGQCSTLSVDGNALEGCFTLDRSFEYPFFSEFPS